ncbi:hypothetical protein [Streptomyces fructofermentans]|uniref:hypothetical protein n=1 Tax=Streptomyces fructofermentans TaxID=152141 RepID=UPI0033CEF9F5
MAKKKPRPCHLLRPQFHAEIVELWRRGAVRLTDPGGRWRTATIDPSIPAVPA